jgi:hypothetical protein
MMLRNSLLALATTALLLPGTAAAQESDEWSWAKTVAAGKAIEIKGVNGAIVATGAPGAEVRVRAEKSARKSDVSEVEIVVLEHAGGVTICALYPSGNGRANECQPGERGRNNVRDNDVRVDFEVQVPRGVQLVARTVNGEVRATGLQSDVEAYTVNGNVETSTSGIVNAQTVNGSIDARMGRADWREELNLETVNGSISLELAGDLNADVVASTVTGGIETDFPLTVTGRFGPKRLAGTIGSGGRELHLSTVNGSIEIRRAGGS